MKQHPFYGTSLDDAGEKIIQTYQPEMWVVEKGTIRALKKAAETGLEYAKEALAEHDATLGRSTIKNASWASSMEEHIRQMENALKLYKKIGK